MKLLLPLACALAASGCGNRESALLPSSPPRPDRLTVVFLGDSLTAGYGVGNEQAYPAVMQRFWTGHGIHYVAVNEGISGDTTEDVLRRLDGSRSATAELTILEIGANDAFSVTPVSSIEANIRSIVARIRKAGGRVVLSSMYLSETYLNGDTEYAREFNGLYTEVGKREKVPVLPPLLRGLFNRGDLFLPDGLHPTAEGHAIIARDLLRDLNPAWSE